MMPMMWGNGFSWIGMILMMLGMFFWVGLLAVVIWAIVRWTSNRAPMRSGATGEPSALEILQRRYARGEIDTDTFDQMRGALEASGAARG